MMGMEGGLKFLTSKRGLFAAAGLAVAIVAAITAVWVRGIFAVRYEKHLAAIRNRPLEYIEQGRRQQSLGRDEAAFQYFQAAIDEATSAEQRAQAGLAMGQYLLARANERPFPHAQMAYNYLVAASRIEKDPGRLLEIYRGLIDASVMLNDIRAVAEACDKACALASDTDEIVELKLKRLDALIKIGGWEETDEAWGEVGEDRAGPGWKQKFDLIEARMAERTLTDADWNAAWMEANTDISDPAGLREALFEKAIGIYDSLAESAPRLAAESIYRAARLSCVENRFDEARRRIKDFYERNYRGYDDEMLFMLLRMARIEGKAAQSSAMISEFLRKYKWRDKSSFDLLEIISQAESGGYYAEAYQILKEYMASSETETGMGRMSFKAGELAKRLLLYDEAMEHFDKALKSGVNEETFAAILLDKADIALKQEDWGEAQRAIVIALTRFPFDSKRGKALYRLVDVFRKSGAPLADTLIVVSMAVEVAPDERGARDALMYLARVYEKMGLYSQAQERYAKAALLKTVDSMGRLVASDYNMLSEALLGSARCLDRMGEFARADAILREMVRIPRGGQVYCDAVYRWAMIAVGQGQRKEAMRRLRLLDGVACSPEIRARVDLEIMLVETAENQRSPESVVEFLNTSPVFSDADRAGFALRAYTLCFDALAAAGDLDGMQNFMERAVESAKGLPVAAWVMQLAEMRLSANGIEDFMESVNRNMPLLGADAEAASEISSMLAAAVSFNELSEKAAAYLK